MREVNEVLKEVRRIQIVANRQVNDLLAGEYLTVFKGRGMEFDSVREYVPGDEIRSIDWNVTARAGTPYVKKFCEERELTVLMAVDISSSGSFGSLRLSKMDTAAEVTLEQVEGGFAITSIHLTLKAKVPGADQATFEALAGKAKAGCPVSKLFKANITLDAMLLS